MRNFKTILQIEDTCTYGVCEREYMYIYIYTHGYVKHAPAFTHLTQQNEDL